MRTIKTIAIGAAFSLSACVAPRTGKVAELDFGDTTPETVIAYEFLKNKSYRFGQLGSVTQRGLYDHAAGIACSWTMEEKKDAGVSVYKTRNQRCVQAEEPAAWKQKHAVSSGQVFGMQTHMQFSRYRNGNETVQRTFSLSADGKAGYAQERVWRSATHAVCLTSYIIPNTLLGDDPKISKIIDECVTLSPIDFAVKRAIAVSPGVSI